MVTVKFIPKGKYATIAESDERTLIVTIQNDNGEIVNTITTDKVNLFKVLEQCQDW
jgi:hypothetical protein